MKIVLLDPSIRSDNLLSRNLGDIIIFESVKKFINDTFPKAELFRISTHEKIDKLEKEIINQADYCFVGGTNIMTSTILNFDRLVTTKKRFFHFFPGFKNIITLGVGWSKYDQAPDFHTRVYYRNILNHKLNLSVRDNYSKSQLEKIGFKNIINTGCPTIWELDKIIPEVYNHKIKDTLITLTDYCRDEMYDNLLLQTIISNSDGKFHFFQQGPDDFEYLKSLDVYKKNRNIFDLVPYNYSIFSNFVNSVTYNFIGTRLHCGIRSLQKRNPALIIGIDNRAIEMYRDFKLPVILRNDIKQIENWIQGKNPFRESININSDSIESWKNQFK